MTRLVIRRLPTDTTYLKDCYFCGRYIERTEQGWRHITRPYRKCWIGKSSLA